MRTIKFRAWDTKNNEMVDDVLVLNYSDMGISHSNKFNAENGFMWRKGVVYMQFTGLHDKNGKEIYEGDIVKNNDEVWDIYYSDDGAWKMGLNGARTSNDHIFLLEPRNSEVIGNIYENPNLLT